MVKNNTLYLKLNKTGLFFFVFYNAKIIRCLGVFGGLFLQKYLIYRRFFKPHVSYGPQIVANSEFPQENISSPVNLNLKIKNPGFSFLILFGSRTEKS